jgi:pyruvate dehydrogenase E2 component (dihydrolipoamide acetyltransferase)
VIGIWGDPMSTPVVMPQMGESIAEGTIVRWIKKVGDPVDRDEPLFEISTDKVDAEIPSPAAGVLTEIKVTEGETVAVNSVVATIGDGKEAAPAGDTPATAPRQGTELAAASTQRQPDGEDPVASRKPVVAAAPAGNGATARPAAASAAHEGKPSGEAVSKDDLRRQKSSPLVRRIAREHNVDITELHGSGIGGRVTKHDILEFLEHPPSQPAAASARPAPPSPQHVAASAARTAAAESQSAKPSPVAGDRVDVQPLSVMRKKIAEHMILSRRTSAHVHSVFHVDFSLVGRIRQQKKAEYERLGAKLTYMAFIAKAAIDALRRHPIVNASMDDQNVVYKKDINVGIAVALETGLIVPVIRNADEKNMLGLSRAISDVADRARSKQLKPEEVQGGTFTITNPGQSGAQFGMPIINQPQVAILGVGTIEKRPVVIDDAIAIRTMAYLTLGFDHRLIDGAVADEFMADIKYQLEHFDSNQV